MCGVLLHKCARCGRTHRITDNDSRGCEACLAHVPILLFGYFPIITLLRDQLKSRAQAKKALHLVAPWIPMRDLEDILENKTLDKVSFDTRLPLEGRGITEGTRFASYLPRLEENPRTFLLSLFYDGCLTTR